MECANGNDSRDRCNNHLNKDIYCLPCNENEENESNKPTSTPNTYPTFIPDYFDVYTSMQAVGFDMDQCDFPGFQLLKIRAKEAIESKGEKKVNDYIKYKKERQRRDKNLLNESKVPFQDTQKHYPPLQQLLPNNARTSNNTSTITSVALSFNHTNIINA